MLYFTKLSWTDTLQPLSDEVKVKEHLQPRKMTIAIQIELTLHQNTNISILCQWPTV